MYNHLLLTLFTNDWIFEHGLNCRTSPANLSILDKKVRDGMQSFPFALFQALLFLMVVWRGPGKTRGAFVFSLNFFVLASRTRFAGVLFFQEKTKREKKVNNRPDFP